MGLTSIFLFTANKRLSAICSLYGKSCRSIGGAFPTLIAIISMFFVGVVASPFQSFLSAILLTSVIVLGVLMTFSISRLLSKTILKGVPSSFTLELPPYRKPQIGKVIVRSIFDRTLFVLGRAAIIAAPAGLVIWIMANIQIGSSSALA
ncbi:MAG: nucleoside recognition, partial [Caproiciproducens sp.]|nr:nucleoside recognition [Caproiciproducens sp.]